MAATVTVRVACGTVKVGPKPSMVFERVVSVDAQPVGPLCVHRSVGWGDKTWTVSHTASGLGLMVGIKGKALAVRNARRLAGVDFDWTAIPADPAAAVEWVRRRKHTPKFKALVAAVNL